jgi:hypothetical protein
MRGLGRLDEARALDRAFAEIIPRPILLSPVGGWLFGSTASSLLLEDRSLALTLLRAEPAAKAKSERAVSGGTGRTLNAERWPLNVWFSWREG